MGKAKQKRAYSSPLRQEQKARTRERIFRALAELVVEHPEQGLTAQAVAKMARVSTATFYRHFQDIPTLTWEFHEWGAALLSGEAHEPKTLDDLFSRSRVEKSEENPLVVRALQDPRIRRRYGQQPEHPANKLLKEAILERLGEDSSEEQRACMFAALRSFFSSSYWVRLRFEFGLSPEQCIETIEWLILTTVEAMGTSERLPGRSSVKDKEVSNGE